MKAAGWIGVDLDGTLAQYTGWQGLACIGNPVPEMQARVKRWLAEGREVRIFTARAAREQDGYTIKEIEEIIQVWCLEHLGQFLQVTCVKDFDMIELWDDRCVAVEANTGRPLSPSTRGL